jgi:CHAT domain-containing protein/tetratricopeptide (TPR) repeat protein
MKQITLRLICFSLLITQLPVFNIAQTRPDQMSQQLEQGKPIERELKGGEIHAYTFKPEAGQFVSIVVNQRGIDVLVLLFAPDGKPLAEVDSPNGNQGPEPVSFLAKSNGDYRLEVRSLEKESPAGRYEIKIKEVRAATEQDRINDLAARLAGAKSKEESEALLAAEREPVTLALEQAVNKEGWRLFFVNNHRQALSTFELALKFAGQLNDKKALARAYTGFGAVYEGLGNFDLSLEYHLKSVALLEQLDDKPRLAQSYANAGHALRFKGEYQRALEYYQKSAALFQEAGDKFSLISELNDAALSYNALGNQQAAAETFEKSLAVFENFEHKKLKAHTLDLLGSTYVTQGRYPKALESFQASLKLAEEIKWLSRSVDIHNHIGVTYYKQGYYTQALESHQKALALAETMQYKQPYAGTLINIADVFFSQGNQTQAAEFYQRSYDVSEKITDSFSYKVFNDRAAMAYALNRLGEIQAGQGNFPAASETYQKSLKLLESIPADSFSNVMTFLLNNIGDLHLAQKNYAEALTYYQKGLALSEKAESESATANSLTSIANVFYLQGNHDESLKAALRASEIGNRIGDREVRSAAQTTAGKVYRALNKPEQARQSFTDAIKNIESLRLNVGGQQTRAAYFARMQEPYEQYIELLMQLHARRPSEKLNVAAFEISERQRARSLLESLNEARADIRQGVDTNLLQREKEIREQLNAKAENQMRLLNDLNPSPMKPLASKEREERAAILQKEILRLTTEYQNIEAQIRQKSPRYAALTQPEPLKLSEIQKEVLDADTILLEYAVGEKQSYLWAVTKDSMKSYELPPRGEIETIVRSAYALLSDGKQVIDDQAQAAYDAEAVRLSQILLAPVAAQIQNKRIVVVADGALQYLPFGALPGPNSKANKRQPVIAENEIVSLPSASTLAVLRRQFAGRTAASKTVAVIADPVFSPTDARVKPVVNNQPDRRTPEPQTSSLKQNFILENAAFNTGIMRDGIVQRLLFSRREAESILAVVPAGEKMQALDFEANRETALSTEMSQYRILHFATHGLLNSENPELSGIVLSLVNEQGKTVDGFLRLNEIFNLNLSADLVVLSACQTALGKEVRGEGLIGLTRGFMYAGSPRVVASLWKVDDVATAELMRIFYQKMLKEKMRPAAALRAAKIEMHKQKRWSAPFYWAAFELQGEWR